MTDTYNLKQDHLIGAKKLAKLKVVEEEFTKFKGNYSWFKSTEDLILNLDYKKQYDYILVKSSNSVNLNIFVEKIKKNG